MESFTMNATTRKKVSKPKIRYVGIAGLKKELSAFEKKYQMPTSTFLHKVRNGEIEDTHDAVKWLGLAEIYQDMMRGK
jgi:hypothetical protein